MRTTPVLRYATSLLITLLLLVLGEPAVAKRLHWHVDKRYEFAGATQLAPFSYWNSERTMFVSSAGALGREAYVLGERGRPQLDEFSVANGSQYPLGIYFGGSTTNIDATTFETEFQGPGIYMWIQQYGQENYQIPLYPHDASHAVLYPIGVTMMTAQGLVLMTATSDGLDSLLYQCDPRTGEGSVLAQLSAPAFHPEDAAAYAPSPIVADNYGNYWFAEPGVDRVANYSPAGLVTEYQLPSGSAPNGLVSDVNGSIWFVEFGAPNVGQIDPSTGTITEYSISESGAPNAVSIASAGSHAYILLTLAGQPTDVGAMDIFNGAMQVVPIAELNEAVQQTAIMGGWTDLDAYFIETNDVARVHIPALIPFDVAPRRMHRRFTATKLHPGDGPGRAPLSVTSAHQQPRAVAGVRPFARQMFGALDAPFAGTSDER